VQATDYRIFGAVVPFVPTRSLRTVTQYFHRNMFHFVCSITCTWPPHIPSHQFSNQEILVLHLGIYGTQNVGFGQIIGTSQEHSLLGKRQVTQDRVGGASVAKKCL